MLRVVKATTLQRTWERNRLCDSVPSLHFLVLVGDLENARRWPHASDPTPTTLTTGEERVAADEVVKIDIRESESGNAWSRLIYWVRLRPC